jgi:hypothetical protein
MGPVNTDANDTNTDIFILTDISTITGILADICRYLTDTNITDI